MKRCVSCGKDIVDAAVNCVFCGSKQTAADALNRTVLGYSTPSVSASRPQAGGAGLTPAALTPQPFTPAPSVVPARDPTPAPATPARMPTPTPAPVRPASEPSSAPRHQLYPFEPWATPARMLMIIAGIVLVATTAAPWRLGDPMVFIWQSFVDGSRAFTAVYPVVVGGVGALVLILGLAPIVPVVRGAVACLVGFGLLVAPAVVARDFRLAGTFAITIVAAAGLLVRHAYRASLAGRAVATVGALGTLASFVVPLPSGTIPLQVALDGIGSSASATIASVVALAATALGLATLIAVWLPPRRSGAGTILAWAWIALMPVGAGAVVAASWAEAVLPGVFFEPVQALALQALGAYGLATLIGKGCEQRA